MARNAKTKSLHERVDLATAESAKAANLALQAMARTAEAGPAHEIGIRYLVDLCGTAAGHLSRANELLTSSPGDAEDAINELDAALECLKKVKADGLKCANALAQSPAKSA